MTANPRPTGESRGRGRGASGSRADKAAPGPKWEEVNTRATYHLPRDLLRAVEDEATRSGRSKSRVVADAIRQHLGLGV